MFKNAKMRSKMIFMCIMVIVPVFLAGVYLIFGMADIVRYNAVKEAITAVDDMKDNLEDVIIRASETAEEIFGDEDINSYINNRYDGRDNPAEIILNYYDQIDGVTYYLNSAAEYNANFIKADGDILESPHYKSAAADVKQKWFVLYDKDREEYKLNIAKSVTGDDGQKIGVAFISFKNEIIRKFAKEEFNAVFSFGDGNIFYSQAEGYAAGEKLPLSEVNYKSAVSTPVTLERPYSNARGDIVYSAFEHEASGEFFQTLIVDLSGVNEKTRSITVMYAWYMALCFILSILLTVLFSSVFSRRIQFLKDQMHNVASGDFTLVKEIQGRDEINELYSDLQTMVSSIRKLMNDAYEAKIQSEAFKLSQMEAEFKSLASQINPHFLYNTLETIRMKAYFNNDKETAELVKKLGKFMRRCLEVKDGMVTIESELEFTKSYLELQSARFGDRVSFHIYSEAPKDYMILPLIIQPIAENAFVHGIEGNKSNGYIFIKVCMRKDATVIEVSDNGQGMNEEKLSELEQKLVKSDTSSGKSIGLTNVNRRIKMYHGESYGITVKSELGQGTVVSVLLPR